ncbi:MAG: TIGR01777 family oxidoreductase [Longimicrobiales bacterium]
MPEFLHESTVPHPAKRVFDWHMRPGALERLTPPWENVRVVGREGGIQDGGSVHLKIRRGPVKADWRLRHVDFEDGKRFADEQVSGPLGAWHHSHEFEENGRDACLVRDRVRWEPPLGSAGRMFGTAVVEKELGRLFRFRRTRLLHDLGRHVGTRRPLTVAITGASGFIGSALSHFLTTGGHTVRPLVRRKPDRDKGEIYWDPMEGKIERDRLDGLDGIVHLAGESLSGGRWTAAKKRAIWKSRLEGTKVLVGALNSIANPPKVLVSSSAIGFYGDRGNEQLTETSSRGKGFLSDLCSEWEEEALKAKRSGIRVVLMRTGVALSPAGGALGTMLLPFKLGVGGRLGSGRQYVSWIDHDDLVALYFHALVTPSVRGPVNGTAPLSVPNSTFTTTLGRVLSRPTFIPVPALAVKGMFGEMGKALLLEGARVLPEAAQQSGFEFFHEGLEDSLRFQLGH